ncbi:UBX domain-containing protein [Heterostelium album PN500]|uniref:UBX domain-containing protein n=1 Tax=Heterostelium pallidum (strain ATCC 26659 / Pp 5 / PN500) TaxID=670386 RepID=D3B4P8_HETP5|nr:UBX domain-containing protein [Heterostelium album PN500]EFA84296.1 UBX domain-containing protein [Heterostelium album PN500]|eukprot:XP_020436412.1 UBX domain-containing protein [Heterostelium album PN500]
MADKEQLKSQFKSITNADDHVCQFYLESHDWNLDSATLSYFEDQPEGGGSGGVSQPQQQSRQPYIEEEEEEDDEPFRPRGVMANQPPPSSSSGSTKKTSGAPARGGVRTLSDFNSDDHSDHDDDDEDDKTQNYFTGGEKSGLMVQSGPKPKKSGDKGVVDDVFDSAKKQGAKPAAERKPNKPESFDSVGYMLGNTQAGQTVQSKPPAKNPDDQTVEVKITFWQQGFTIDDGPLRGFDRPENREFLMDIQRGVIPRELEANAPPGGLSIVLLDNRQKDYVEPAKPRYVAFSGSGQALGSTPSSTSTTTTTSSTSSSSSSRPTTTTATTTTTAPTVEIDRSQPTTVIQIRMADGSRQQATFNETHTLQQLINYINAINNNTRPFDLLSGFPMKPIPINPSQSLKDAGLLGALIQQKFK